MAEAPLDEKRCEYLRDKVGLLTESDLMALLNVTHHTTQAWRLSGSGPDFVKLGKRVYYRVSDLTDWIENNVRSRTRPDDDDEAKAA